MANIITRRDVLAAGAGLAALHSAGAFAQLRVQGAAAEAPKLKIESGATLRILRPVRFVQPDEDIFRANAARFASASRRARAFSSRSRCAASSASFWRA